MKTLIAFLLCCFTAGAASVTFTFDPAEDATVTYRICIATNDPGDILTNTAFRFEIGTNTTFKWDVPFKAANFWAWVIGTDTNGISGEPSNVVRFGFPSPKNLRIRMALLSGVTSNGPWEPVDGVCLETEVPVVAEEQYYRAMVMVNQN